VGIDVHIDFVKASRGVRARVSLLNVTGLEVSTSTVAVQATHGDVYVVC
jgi:hypothetical protein